MSRLWPDGAPITVTLDRQGHPTAFVWCGRTHLVAQVRQRWQVDTDWWGEAGRVWRVYVAVTTASGLLCVLYQDLESGEWFLSKIYD
jgi:hypothetical protein